MLVGTQSINPCKSLAREERIKFEKWSIRFSEHFFLEIPRLVLCPNCDTRNREIMMLPKSRASANNRTRFSIIHFCPYCGVYTGNGQEPTWYFIEDCPNDLAKIWWIFDKIGQLGCPTCKEAIPFEILEEIFCYLASPVEGDPAVQNFKPRPPKYQLQLPLN